MYLSGGGAWKLDSWTNLEAWQQAEWKPRLDKRWDEGGQWYCHLYLSFWGNRWAWHWEVKGAMAQTHVLLCLCQSLVTVKEACWHIRSGQEADSVSSETKTRLQGTHLQQMHSRNTNASVVMCESSLAFILFKFHLAIAVFLDCHYQMMQIISNVLRTYNVPGTVFS